MLPEGIDGHLVESFFLDLYEGTQLPIAEAARRTEEHFCLREGLGITTFQHLLLENRIGLDLSQPIDLVSARTGKGGAYSWMPLYV